MYTVSNKPFQLHIYPKHFMGKKKKNPTREKNSSSARRGLGKHIRKGIFITIINKGPIKAAMCKVGPCLAGKAVRQRFYPRCESILTTSRARQAGAAAAATGTVTALADFQPHIWGCASWL